jgi:hypothetical protein
VAGVTTDLHVAVPVAAVTMLVAVAVAVAAGAWLSAARP